MTLKDYVNWGITHCDKTVDVEGVPLVMEKCVKNKKMKQLEVYGESVQIGGKNIYDSVNYPLVDGRYIYASSGAYYAASSDYTCATEKYIPCAWMRGKTYTINYVKGYSAGIAFYDANKSYISGVAYMKDTAVITFTFTVPNDAVYFRFTAENSHIGEIQIEEGSVATEYEPFIAPSPENSIEVESVGEKCTKNLFDVDQFEAQLRTGYILNDSGAEVVDKISTYSTYKIPIQNGETIYINGWFQRFYIYDADGVLLLRSTALGGSRRKMSYTPSADGYIGFQIKNSEWQNNKGTEQVELGSTATEYEPYGKFKVPVVVRGKNFIDHSVARANSYSEYGVLGTSYTIRGNVGGGRVQATTGQLMFPLLNNIETYGMEVTAGKTYRITFDYLLKERGAYDNYISLIIYGTSNAVRLTNGYVKGVVGETISYNFSFTSEYDEKVCLCFRINNNLVTLSDIRFEDADVEPITTNVYLNEPLRKIGDYVDVLDFKGQKVIRNIHEEILDGVNKTKFNVNIFSAGTAKALRLQYKGTYAQYYLPTADGLQVSYYALCNMYPVVTSEKRGEHTISGSTSTMNMFDIVDSDYQTVDEWDIRLQELYDEGMPLKITHALKNPIEETIECEIPKLNAKTSIVEIDTALLPSNIKGKYIKR